MLGRFAELSGASELAQSLPALAAAPADRATQQRATQDRAAQVRATQEEPAQERAARKKLP